MLFVKTKQKERRTRGEREREKKRKKSMRERKRGGRESRKKSEPVADNNAVCSVTET